MTRSRAGVLLGCVALLGAAFMLWRWRTYQREEGRERTGARGWLLVIGAISAILVLQFGLLALLQRFDVDPLEDGRWEIAGVTLQAIDKYGATGAGAGTFIHVYASAEPPELRSTKYVNRAHNDWLEWLLEGGLPMLVLLLSGLILVARPMILWWRRTGPAAVWGQGSSIALVVVLGHSLFDYPLRTTAMATIASVLLVHTLAHSAITERRSVS